MKNILILIIAFIVVPELGFAQSTEELNNRFLELTGKMQTHIAFGKRCNQLTLEMSDFNTIVNRYIENDNHGYVQLQSLVQLKKNSEAYYNFLCVLGAKTKLAVISREDLMLIANMFNLELVEINDKDYCVPIILVKIKSYSCWLVYNNSNTVKRISIEYNDNRNGYTQCEFGVMEQSYKAFKNNSLNPTIRTLTFVDFLCHDLGYSMQDF